ncbi:MAG: hypothetical protein ACRD2J_05600 [Thermoanaerobaculia bacterium]
MRYTALLLIALLPACAMGPQVSQAELDAVTLVAEPAGGDTIRLTLTNGSMQSVGYNLCASALQRREGSVWMPVESDVVCTLELRTLAPSESTTYDQTIPDGGLEPGVYRYTTSIEIPLGTPQRPLVTPSFRIG